MTLIVPPRRRRRERVIYSRPKLAMCPPRETRYDVHDERVRDEPTKPAPVARGKVVLL